VFFGCYHIGDYLRIFLHIGQKKIFFCGSDILALSPRIAPLLRGEHYCENEVEKQELYRNGIRAVILPMIFTEFESKDCYKQADNPRVFATYHKGRERSYGYFEHPQIDWLCDMPEKEFDKKIRQYQGCARFNHFDGFAESLAKSVLLGQYQWSEIPYEGMGHTATFEQWLKSLKDKKQSNPRRLIWKDRLEKNLQTLLTF
jgi:hypothetical protein